MIDWLHPLSNRHGYVVSFVNLVPRLQFRYGSSPSVISVISTILQIGIVSVCRNGYSFVCLYVFGSKSHVILTLFTSKSLFWRICSGLKLFILFCFLLFLLIVFFKLVYAYSFYNHKSRCASLSI